MEPLVVLLQRVVEQAREAHPVALVHEDADDAEAGAAQGEGVVCAGGALADGEDAAHRVEAIGEAVELHGGGDILFDFPDFIQ